MTPSLTLTLPLTLTLTLTLTLAHYLWQTSSYVLWPAAARLLLAQLPLDAPVRRAHPICAEWP